MSTATPSRRRARRSRSSRRPPTPPSSPPVSTAARSPEDAMKYTVGGIGGKTGESLALEVPVAGKPLPQEKKPSGGGGGGTPGADPTPAKTQQLDAGRVRFSAWVKSANLLYENPAKG